MKNAFNGVFNGRKVFVTGHTGFKGSWLALWLQELGAETIGYSLPPPTTPSHFSTANISCGMTDIQGDVRDFTSLKQTIDHHQPSVIFHLAAQPLVLHSFEQPKETFDVNVGGTINVLEASRHCHSIKAIVIITSDKCYENKEWFWGYRETDSLGGHDPYSVSKSMAESVITSYRNAFFQKNKHPAAIASARAGNVIGGGDFSAFRIVPDCMKALLAREPIRVRNPRSIRPWLNVLDPLSGYLWLASCLLEEGHKYAEAWNFGPLEQEGIDVQTLVEKAIDLWGDGDWLHTGTPDAKPEMGLLRLNWDKAAHLLRWKPTYSWTEALKQTVDWTKAFEKYAQSQSSCDMRQLSTSHIQSYLDTAKERTLFWATSRNRSHHEDKGTRHALYANVS